MRKRSKLSVLVLVSFFVLSLFPANVFAASFTDVSGASAWAEKYVEKLAELGVINGVSAGKFDPAGKVTRAQFAKMIVEAKGLAQVTPATATFTDVAASNWAYGYVEAAADAGYVNGMGNGKFAPDAYITREQIAKIVVEAAGLDADASKPLTFADAAQIAAWAKGYVAVAADKGFVNGYTDNTFRPAGNATRAEAAKLVYTEMVYDGKIKEETPAGYKKVTENPGANATEIELDGESYTIKNDNYKIAGEYVDDVQVFIEGTLVKVAFNNDDEILSIEADVDTIEGEVDGLGKTGDDRTVDIDGTEVTWVDSDDYDPNFTDNDILTYGDIQSGDKLIVLLNNDGLGFAALEMDSETVKGSLTGIGVTADEEFYFVVDGTKYFSEDDQDVTNNGNPADITFIVNRNNATVGNTYGDLRALLDRDVVAELEFNAKGKVTEVKAYSLKVTAVPNLDDWDANGYVFDGKNYDNILILGDIAIGEKGTSNNGNDTRFERNFRPVNSSIEVTVNGTKVDYEDLDEEIDNAADYTATATVNAKGEVIKLVFTDESVFGQIQSVVENSKDEITKVTIDGKEYTLNDEIDNDPVAVKKGDVLRGTILTSGKLDVVEIVRPIFEANSTSKFQQYKVVATRFEEGLDPNDADDSKSFVTGAAQIRIQNVDTGVVTEITVDTFVKGSDDIKLSLVKVGDTIVLVEDGDNADTNYAYAVIAPITANK